MSVKNGQRWILESLESLAGQTYRDFEIVLVDDGCTDTTVELAKSMGIPELRVLPGPNEGLARALALGVRESRGSLIARQDADDVSEPSRLDRQVRYLDEHPNCIAVGSWATEISESGVVTGIIKAPISDRSVRIRALLFSPMIHPSVTVRRAAILSVGNYRSPGVQTYAEDYDLWSRLIQVGEIHNIPEPLIRYRRSATGITTISPGEIAVSSSRIAATNLASRLGLQEPAPDDVLIVGGYYERLRGVRFRDAMNLVLRLLRARISFGLHPAPLGLPWWTYIAPLAWVIPASRQKSRHGD